MYRALFICHRSDWIDQNDMNEVIWVGGDEELDILEYWLATKIKQCMEVEYMEDLRCWAFCPLSDSSHSTRYIRTLGEVVMLIQKHYNTHVQQKILRNNMDSNFNILPWGTDPSNAYATCGLYIEIQQIPL